MPTGYIIQNGETVELIACGKQCPVCHEWKNSYYKIVDWSALHCHFCYYAGKDYEYDLVGNLFLCLPCAEIVRSAIRYLPKREYSKDLATQKIFRKLKLLKNTKSRLSLPQPSLPQS